MAYGNASEKPREELWDFTCQHGENECDGNMYETCIKTILKP